MVSKILRRSGIAVCQYCSLIEFEPSAIYLVGIGPKHQETDVFRETWPEVFLYGFEPHPRVFEMIQETFQGRAYPFAISDYVGVDKLYDKSNHLAGSSLFKRDIDDKGKDWDTINVEVKTLDSWVSTTVIPVDDKGLLWLDCEGSELNALKGGYRFLQDFVSVVNVEMTGRPYGSEWPSSKEVHDYLVQQGFRRAWFHTTRVHQGQYDAIYVRQDLLNPAYCSCPCSLE